MESELLARRLAANPLLAGLVEHFRPELILIAANEALGFPPELITSHSEAGRVAAWLNAN